MTVLTVTLNPCIDKSCTVERVAPERKLRARDVARDPGGGGINVARVIARLGGRVRALWTCGGDTGRRLARLLEEEAVPNEPIEVEGEVRENVIVNEASCEHQYRFGMPGPRLTDQERARWIDRLRGSVTSMHYVVLSGSMPAEAPLEWYAELLRCVPDDVRVVVDTKQAALREAIERGVWLIKPNVRELEQITDRELGSDERIGAAAREVVERGGAEVVIVSLGRGGALLATAGEIRRYASPSVPLRSKIGAGDSMVGGLVQALVDERPLADAVAFGVAAGAAAVMTPGTELCRRGDVDELFPSVEHREVRR